MPMKRKISTFLFGLLFLIGFGILIYPTVSNQWNTYRQNQLISSYDNTIQDMEPEDFTSEWENAKAFNDTIQQNNLYGDVFGEDENDIKDTEYWKILNVADDGVMGYLSIPKINIKLAIYHGTGDDELQTGVGHLNGTKLPLGGILDQSFVMAFAFLRLFFIKTIEANAGYDTSQSHLFRHIGRDTRALIHVEESGRATFYHFQAR